MLYKLNNSNDSLKTLLVITNSARNIACSVCSEGGTCICLFHCDELLSGLLLFFQQKVLQCAMLDISEDSVDVS